MDQFGAFLLAAFALAGSPGPNTLSIAAVSAAFGRVAALPYMFGLVLGMLGVMAIIGSGVSALLFTLPGLRPVVVGLAATYFVFLAWRIATAPPLKRSGGDRRQPRWFEGTLLSLVNPKAYAAMGALFSGFVLVAGDPLVDGLVKTVAVLGVLFTVNICWLFARAGLTRFHSDERSARAINVAFAILLLVSVAATLLL
jgi:threonine/homoserine/homoserine lactone efflux protein